MELIDILFGDRVDEVLLNDAGHGRNGLLIVDLLDDFVLYVQDDNIIYLGYIIKMNEIIMDGIEINIHR